MAASFESNSLKRAAVLMKKHGTRKAVVDSKRAIAKASDTCVPQKEKWSRRVRMYQKSEEGRANSDEVLANLFHARVKIHKWSKTREIDGSNAEY